MKIIILCITFLISISGQNIHAQSSRGTEFWCGFMALNPEDNSLNRNYVPYNKLAISSEPGTKVTVSVPKRNWSQTIITEKAIELIEIPQEFNRTISSGKVEDKGIHIISEKPVSVTGFVSFHFGSDATSFFPVEELGEYYMVAAYQDNIHQPYEDLMYGEFLIVASENDMRIRITPSRTDWGGVREIILQQGETYQLYSFGDPTGTIVESTNGKNFALFGGNMDSHPPPQTGGSATNHLVEQIPPVNRWKKDYIQIPYDPLNRLNELVRIIASEDGTEVIINSERTITLNKGKYYDTLSSKIVTIKSDKPVLVASYTGGLPYNPPNWPFNCCAGDATFHLVPALDQMQTGITNLTTEVVDFPNSKSNTVIDYVTLIAPKGETGDITIDGTSISSLFRPVPNRPDYVWAQMSLSKGIHTIKSSGRYQGYANGIGYAEAYSYVIGSRWSMPVMKLPKLCLQKEGEFRGESSEEISEWKWHFGDGDSASGQTVRHSYKNTGWFNITLIVRYKYANPDTIHRAIEILPPPNPAITGKMLCTANDVTTLSAMREYKSYKWSTGDTTRSIKVSLPGKYSLMVTDTLGCTGIAEAEVKVIDMHSSISGARSICFGAESTQYKADKHDDVSYEWTASGGEILSGKSSSTVTVDWKQKGVGTLQLQMKHNFYGCTFDTVIAVTVADKLDIAIGGKKNFCRGSSTELSVDAGYAGYEWQLDGEKISTEEKIIADKAGKYSVKVRSEAGCEGFAEADVTENIASVEIFADKTKICPGEKAAISANKNFVSYTWSNGETAKEILVGAGKYSLTAIDENGCEGISGEISIEEFETKISGAENILFATIEPNQTDKKKISWVNSGRDTVEISLKKNFVSGEFSFVSNPVLPAKIAPGEAVEFEINFAPTEEKNYSDKLEFSLSPCDKEKILLVEGRAEKNILHALVSTIDTTIMIGERLLVPIKIQLDEDKILEKKFSSVVKINANVLFVEGVTNGILTKGNIAADGSQELIIEVENVELSNKKFVAAELKTLGLISVEKTTPVEFLSADFGDKNILVRKENGVVNVVDACFNQPVKSFTPSALTITPNPVSDIAEMEIIFSKAGNYTAEIFTSEGKFVKKIFFSAQTDGEKILHREAADDYPSGSYFITLTTPDQTLKQRFFVVR